MVKRGEIYWLRLFGSGSEQTGRRPVLVVQNDTGNRFSPTTVVAAITSQPRSRQYPFHVSFAAKDSSLEIGGIILCEQIQTVDQTRLEAMAGKFAEGKMQEVDIALRWSLGLR